MDYSLQLVSCVCYTRLEAESQAVFSNCNVPLYAEEAGDSNFIDGSKIELRRKSNDNFATLVQGHRATKTNHHYVALAHDTCDIRRSGLINTKRSLLNSSRG